MIKKLIILFSVGLLFFSCGEDNKPTNEVEHEVPLIQFKDFDEKISYCIGLDHGLGAAQIYGAKQNEGKFYLSEIQNGLIDYLTDGDLRIPVQNVEPTLEKYLLPGGEVNTDEVSVEDASYCVGLTEGQYVVDGLVGRGIDQIVYVDFLVLGIEHGMEGTTPVVAPTEARSEIKNYYSEINLEQGQAFLENNARDDSVAVTESGLQYKVMGSGNGVTPRLTDTCVIHYTGRFLDGRVFESTIPSQVPAQLTPIEVIQGWQEALLMMKEGDQWRIFIPYHLAYGEEGSGPIEPYSLLIFDMELIKVKRYSI